MSVDGGGRLDRADSMGERYVIDPSGQTWDVDQLATHQEAGPTPIVASGQSMLEALVMDKGYAGLRLTATACHVFINPSKMHPATVSALLSAVSSQSTKLVVSGCYQETWRYKLHVSTTDIVDHITMLMEQEQRTDCLKSRELSPADLDRCGTLALRETMQLTLQAGKKLNPEFLTNIARLTRQRFVVCSWQSKGQLWRIDHSGSGYGNLLNLSPRQFMGTQPAYQYGCWVHDRYLEVRTRAAPVIEDVDAVTFTPGIGRRRLRYRRILAPMLDEKGCEALLSTSVRDTTIDLGASASVVSVRP